MHKSITTKRLILVTLGQDFLKASLKRDAEAARGLHGWNIPDDWFEETILMKIRIDDCDADHLYTPWSLRAVVLRASNTMVGHIGFHSRPGPAYLEKLAPGGVELGYTIFKPFQRHGYALEAIHALIGWAASSFAVTSFAISIAPSNAISQGLARKIGFQRVGGHQDPVDGWEDVYILQGEPLQRFIQAT